MINAIIGDYISSSPKDLLSCDEKYPTLTSKMHISDLTILLLAVVRGVMDGYGDDGKTEIKVKESIEKMQSLYPTFQPKNIEAGMCGVVIGKIYIQLSEIEKYSKAVIRALNNYTQKTKEIVAIASAIGIMGMSVKKNRLHSYVKRKYWTKNRKVICQSFDIFFQEDTYMAMMKKSLECLENKKEVCVITSSLTEGIYSLPVSIKEQAIEKLGVPLKEIYDRYWSFLIEKRYKVHDHNDCRLCPAFQQCRGNHKYK